MANRRTVKPEHVELSETVITPVNGRSHVATYTRLRDVPMKWFIRVVGPHGDKFSHRTVPVVTKSGVEHDEDLTRLVGTFAPQDGETGTVGIYEFNAKPRDAEALDDEIPF